MIPVYLMVGGCVGLLKLFSLLWRRFKARREEDAYVTDDDGGAPTVIQSKSSRFSDAVVTLFLFVWFVCGNVWVFRVWPPNFAPPLEEPSNWCHRTVYMYALVQIVVCHSVLGLFLLIVTFLTVWFRAYSLYLDDY
jgi:hypothetical protein